MIDLPFPRPPSVLRPLLWLGLGWALVAGAGCATAPDRPTMATVDPLPARPPMAAVDPLPARPPMAAVDPLPARPPNLQLVSRDRPVPLFDWTEPVDFDGFRHWFGRREDFAARCEGAPARDAAGYALLAGDHAESERLTAPLVTACPVDPSLHLWRFASLMALGRTAEAELHHAWYQGLMESILSTGDGVSASTPIVTISNAETWAVLSHLGLTAERQWTVAGPPALEIFEARSDAGTRMSVYFHPAFRALRAGPRGRR
ncbi:MAG: hypothetical protein AAGC67_01550 [Myxococcota bacterium]